MATSIFGAEACACNIPASFPPLIHICHRPAPAGGSLPAHPGLADPDHLTPDEQVILLAAIDESGYATLGDLADALPEHPRPIRAVLALEDAGLVELDRGAPFDAHLTVWRVRA